MSFARTGAADGGDGRPGAEVASRADAVHPGTDAVAQAPEATSAAGDEMAVRVHELDWAATPLGSADRWPQSLKTPVRILLTSRFAMWMGWGPQLTFLYNDAYGRVTLGKKHPWALGRPAHEVWAEIWDEIGPRIEQVMETGVATWDEGLMLFLERSGYTEETYHTFSYSPLPDDDGTVGGMLCVVSEETDRIIGERRLATLQNLAASLATVTTESDVFNGMRRGIGQNQKDLPFTLLYLFESDEAGNVTARLAASTGFAAAHAAAMREIPVHAVSSDDGARGWPAASIYLDGARVVIGDVAQRFAALPTGAWETPAREALAVPIMEPGQEKPAGFLISAINPFRRLDAAYSGFIDLIAGQIGASLANARTQEKERRRAEALAELDRAKTQFFSNVSHEFRTPLTLILGPTEDALVNPDVPANRAGLETIHRNAIRLLKLVNTLLDFSRIEAGRIDARYQRTNLGELTSELASAFRSAIDKAGLRLELEAPSLDAPVFVDRDMWEKIVLNLLSNAFKHTFAGTIRVVVQQRDQTHVEMIVQDTGIGIPRDQLPHLFERFYRVPNARSRTHEGTGIGLSLVQELVRLHGGTIDVTSQEQRGTTFTVRIPLGTSHLPQDHVWDASKSAPVPTTSARTAYTGEAMRWLPDAPPSEIERLASDADTIPGASSDLALAGARILLVDDNADMREYAGRLLRGRGWHVETAPDGATALEMAQASPPDLMLSDVMMPGLDGFGLLRAMRSDPRTRLVPIILLSARAGEEARVEGLDRGADDYLVKPFSAQELLARVRSHLTLARARASASAAVADAYQQLTRVLEQAPVAVCVLRGPNHVFELANPSYRALTGGRDLIGHAFGDLFPEPDAQIVLERLNEVYATGQPFIGRRIPVAFDREGDGVIVPGYFNYTSYPLTEHGQVTGIITVATEITDEVLAKEYAERAQREAESARREAETANRAKSDFLAAMSHELRTPLNAIAGYIELVEMGIHGPITEAQRDVLGRVRRSERHLLALINDVLNFAKLEAGHVEYVPRRFDLVDLVGPTAPLIEPQFAAKQIDFEWRIQPGLHVWADEDKVRQILLNLLANAVKFTDRHGKVFVDATTRDDGLDGGRPDAVFLRVSDTGIGIPLPKFHTIFDPFVQVHRNLRRTTEGTGLGLSISRDLAKGMGGDLRVRSAEGEGSTFTLTLPRGPAADA